MRGISWIAENRSASQGLCSMQLVISHRHNISIDRVSGGIHGNPSWQWSGGCGSETTSFRNYGFLNPLPLTRPSHDDTLMFVYHCTNLQTALFSAVWYNDIARTVNLRFRMWWPKWHQNFVVNCSTWIFLHFTITTTDSVRTHVRTYSFHWFSIRFPLPFN